MVIKYNFLYGLHKSGLHRIKHKPHISKVAIKRLLERNYPPKLLSPMIEHKGQWIPLEQHPDFSSDDLLEIGYRRKEIPETKFVEQKQNS